MTGSTGGLEHGGCTGLGEDFSTGRARARSSVSSEKNKPHRDDIVYCGSPACRLES